MPTRSFLSSLLNGRRGLGSIALPFRGPRADYRPDFPAIPQGIAEGRSVRDGYARGWGLEFGGLERDIAGDPIYREAARLANGRSLISLPRRMNLYLLLRFYLPELPPGDIIEFGAYRGGNALFLARAAQLLGLKCDVWALDTFAGMPPTDATIDAHRAADFANVDLSELETLSRQQGLDNLHWVKGTFEETTDDVLRESRPIALAHIDCDIRSAVRYAYNRVRPNMVQGGYIAFDDATTSSCIGATEVVEQDVIRRDGLNSEQIWPHFVFRAP
jgi:predicted O-methyltransferase YrrM